MLPCSTAWGDQDRSPSSFCIRAIKNLISKIKLFTVLLPEYRSWPDVEWTKTRRDGLTSLTSFYSSEKVIFLNTQTTYDQELLERFLVSLPDV